MKNHNDEFLNDDELSGAFSINGAEPSDEHIELVRHQITLHTTPAMTNRMPAADSKVSVNTRRRQFRIPVSLVSIAAVVLIMLLVARPFAEDAAAGLQNSLTTTRKALWIHGSTTIEHRDKVVTAESWCSPAERIAAFRSPEMMHFVDYKLGLQFSYSEEHGRVFQWNADPTTEGFGRQFVHTLLNDQDLKSSFLFHEVSAVNKTVVHVGGNTAMRYSYHVQMKENPDVRWETSIQTDPDSGRIILWEDRHANGMHVKVLFDYPNYGPHDIRELGAPSTAEVVRITTPDSDLFRN